MSVISSIRNYLSFEPRDLKLAVRGASQGLGIFVAFVLLGSVISSAIAVGMSLANLGLSAGNDVNQSLGFGFMAAIASVAMSANLVIGDIPSALLFTEVSGSIPILAVFMFLILRRIGRHFPSSGYGSSIRGAWINALSVAVGFIASSALISLVLSSGNYLDGSTAFGVIDVADAFVAGTFVTIVILWSSHTAIRNQSEFKAPHIGDLLSKLFAYLLTSWVAVLVGAALVFVAFVLIEPDFRRAIETSSPDSAGASSIDWGIVDWGLVIGAIILFLAMLPALAYYFFVFIMGGSLGFEESFGNLVKDAIEFVSFGQLGSGVTDFSIFSISPVAGFVLLLVLFFVAVFAGTAASRKSGYKVTGISNLPMLIGFFGLVFFFLQQFFYYSVATSNRGSTQANLAAGGLELEETFVGYGASSASMLLFALIFGLAAYFGAGLWRAAFDDAFSTPLSVLTGKRAEGQPAGLSGSILATATVTLVAIAASLPLGIATVERVWAAYDGPVQSANKVFEFYKSGTVAEAKARSSSSGSWLPDQVLDQARNLEGFELDNETLNNIGSKWQVGDIDTKTTYIAQGDGRNFVIEIESLGSSKQYWEIDHPLFTSSLVSSKLILSAPPALKSKKDFSFTVNGQKVSYGEFQALPGVYKVKAPGFGLLGAMDHEFFVSSGIPTSIDFSQSLAIPDAGLEELDKAMDLLQESCRSISSLAPVDCPTASDFEKALVVPEGADVSGGVMYVQELTSEDYADMGITISDNKVKFLQQCKPVTTEITALAKSVPKGVKVDFDTAITKLDCTYTYSLERTFKDAIGKSYTVPLEGESHFLFYIVGSMDDSKKTYVAGQIQRQDLTEYPE